MISPEGHKPECNEIHTRLNGLKIRVVLSQEQITAAIVSAINKSIMLSFEDMYQQDENGKWLLRKVTIWPGDISHIMQVLY
jgi:hypothetical protein